MDSIYQNFFDFMHEQHGLTLLQSEMQEIVDEAVKLHNEIERQSNLDRIKEGKRRQRLDPYGRFEGNSLPDWIEECCYNCSVPLYDEPGLPTKDGDEWYCEDCATDYTQEYETNSYYR